MKDLAEKIERMYLASRQDLGFVTERIWFTANGDLHLRCRNAEEVAQLVAALRAADAYPLMVEALQNVDCELYGTKLGDAVNDVLRQIGEEK